MIIKGNSAADGIAIAKCLLIKERQWIDYTNERISIVYTENEIEKFFCAREILVKNLENIMKNELRDSPSIKNDVMEVHLTMLKDPMLSDSVIAKIKREQYSALGAVQKTIEEISQVFETTKDVYFCERALDIRDIGGNLLNQLIDVKEIDLSNLKEDVILAAKEIMPSQLATAETTRVKGIITESGGSTSHTVIIAKNLDIPVVTGIPSLTDVLKDGEFLIINGADGTIETGIDEDRKKEINKIIKIKEQEKSSLKLLIDKPVITFDGSKIKLFANIIDNNGAMQALKMNTDGIGLFRTEFLFMDRTEIPSEEEQFQVYKDVLQTMEGKPVTIRTLDIGGDKESTCLNLPKESNPFLGYRAIRICLNDKNIFKTQLRAILRASAFGNAHIMYPMISSLEEVLQANDVLNEARTELLQEGFTIGNNIPVGIMIEIPSAAAIADILIKEVDFFSIGTNDLTQYLLAVDRMNEKISNLYNYFHPGVLRVIAQVIEAVNNAGADKAICMCGEMAGDPAAVLLLLGMGLKEFSMNPGATLKIRQIVSLTNLADAKLLAAQILKMSTAESIEKLVKYKYDEKIFELQN